MLSFNEWKDGEIENETDKQRSLDFLLEELKEVKSVNDAIRYSHKFCFYEDLKRDYGKFPNITFLTDCKTVEEVKDFLKKANNFTIKKSSGAY